MSIHWGDVDLVDDNMFVVQVDCPTCFLGSPTDACTCMDGIEHEVADLGPFLHNIAVAGALCEARLPCSSGWQPGEGKPWRRGP